MFSRIVLNINDSDKNRKSKHCGYFSTNSDLYLYTRLFTQKSAKMKSNNSHRVYKDRL